MMLSGSPTFVPKQFSPNNRPHRPSVNVKTDSSFRLSFYPACQNMPAPLNNINQQPSTNKSYTQSFSSSESPPFNPMNSPVSTQDFLRIPKRIFDEDNKKNDTQNSSSTKKKIFVPRAEQKKLQSDDTQLIIENMEIDRKINESTRINIIKQPNEEKSKQMKVYYFNGEGFLINRNKTESFQSFGAGLKNKYRMSEVPSKSRNFQLPVPEETEFSSKQKINTILSAKNICQESPKPSTNKLIPSSNKDAQICRSSSKRKHYISVTPTKYKKPETIFHLKSLEKSQRPSFVPSKKSINRFQILKLIGSSRLSEAYVCMDKKSYSIYCLKKIKKSLINESPSLLNRFIRKVGLQFRSVHPNIIQIYDVFCDNEFVYLVEEYMQGGSLREFLNDQNIILDQTKNEQCITEKLYNINSGLNYIHNLQNQKRVKVGPRIHGDLRPETVLMNFGCCKISPINPIKIEKTVSFLHPYVCPEALVEQVLSAKSDMWNLGLILFQLCAKRCLFKVQQSKQDMSLADQIVNTDYNKQILNIQYVTHPLKDLLRKLLKIRPDERLSSSEVMSSNIIKKRGLQAKEASSNSEESESPEMQKFRRQIKAQNNNFPKYHYNPTRLNTCVVEGVGKN